MSLQYPLGLHDRRALAAPQPAHEHRHPSIAVSQVGAYNFLGSRQQNRVLGLTIEAAHGLRHWTTIKLEQATPNVSTAIFIAKCPPDRSRTSKARPASFVWSKSSAYFKISTCIVLRPNMHSESCTRRPALGYGWCRQPPRRPTRPRGRPLSCAAFTGTAGLARRSSGGR